MGGREEDGGKRGKGWRERDDEEEERRNRSYKLQLRILPKPKDFPSIFLKGLPLSPPGLFGECIRR